MRAWTLQTTFPVLVAALILMALPSTIAFAGAGIWTSGGPYGGAVHSIAIDPTNSAKVYAGPRGGGLYRSIDAGGHWTEEWSGLEAYGILALVLDPNDPATVYAGTAFGRFRSPNSGKY